MAIVVGAAVMGAIVLLAVAVGRLPWITAIVLLPLLGRSRCWPSPPATCCRRASTPCWPPSARPRWWSARWSCSTAASGGLQLVDRYGWAERSASPGASGVDGLSIWLLALTAGIFLLAIVAACWRLPERGAAYLGLILLLAETGLLGLFAAGDLVLFYVFWEAMLIPFYFLIGMWGGPDRRRGHAQVRHLHDGRQPADAGGDPGHGLRGAGRDRPAHLLDRRRCAGSRSASAQSTWLFLGFAIAFAIKLPMWPLPRLAAGRLPRGAARW